MEDSSSSHPPSYPRALTRPPDGRLTDARLPDATGALVVYQRPAQWQTGAAVVLAGILVAVPWYMWRRPRSVVAPIGSGVFEAPQERVADAALGPADLEPRESRVVFTLGAAKVLGCADSPTKKTLPEACDQVVGLQKAFAESVAAAKDCVAPGQGGQGGEQAGATITYVADVVFARRRSPIVLTLPKDGRTITKPKTLATCAATVRHGLSTVALDKIAHAHARYKIALVATYPP